MTSANSGPSTPLIWPILTLSEWGPTHKHVSASALAATAFSAMVTVAMPRLALRRRAPLIQTVRHCTAVSAGAAAQASSATTGATTAAARRAGCADTLCGQLCRRQLHPKLIQPQQQHPQQHHGQLLMWPSQLLRCGPAACSPSVASAAAAAAATRAGAAAAAQPGLGAVGGVSVGLLWRRAAFGLPGPLSVRQLMSTQASGAAASGAPPRGLGLLKRFRGRLGDALRLQLAAAWQTYGTAVYGAATLAAVFVLWRLMRRTTNAFIAVNDKMAEYGVMALAASVVLLTVQYFRWRTAVNPAAVYRQAMMRLNTHPGVLEVMGAPLVGSPVRAYVVTGGGMYLSKRFRIKLRSRRIQMMFPLSGSERKGLVSLEAKRKHGRYLWRLLAVDLGPELQTSLPTAGSTGLSAAPLPRRQPTAAEGTSSSSTSSASAPSPPSGPAPVPLPPHPRVYVVGDLGAYQRGGVLGELRAPFLKALSNSRSYEVEDELEDELDELALPGSSDGGGARAAGSAVRRALASAAAAITKPVAAAADAAADVAAAATAAPLGDAAGTAGSAPPPAQSAGSARRPEAAAATITGGLHQRQGAPGWGQSEGQRGSAEERSSPSSSSSSWWGRLRTVVSGPVDTTRDAKK